MTVVRDDFGPEGDLDPPPGEGAAETTEDSFEPDWEDAEDLADQDTIAALQEEWGAHFETNLGLAREAARVVADDDLVVLFEETGLGNDPRIIRAAARIGRLLQHGREHGSPLADATDRDALEETLDELSCRPDYWSDRVQRRVRQLHLALHGSEPIGVYRGVESGGKG